MAKQQRGSNSDGSEEDDVAARLYQIVQLFEGAEYLTSAEFEDLLDEVQGYVKSIDVAKELHSLGLLVHLLHHLLYYPHARTRAKTAEVVATMVKNNPRSQQLVMEVNGLQPLLYNLISDPDATSRTKALSAIFSLIRNNKPGITAFRLANGYAALVTALDSEIVMLQREVLNLILYLLHENSSDNNILIELEFHRIMIYLQYSDDAEVREAALRGLLVLAKDEGGNNGQLVKNDDEVKKVLRNQIEGIIVVAPEDLDVTREEIQLMDSLWNACYNEPSLLRQKGLLVLPGEDAPAPDVPSKLFEPPLRGAWAAAEAAGRNSVSEKKDAPLLLNTRVKNDDKLKQVLWELKLVLHELKQVPQERIEKIIRSASTIDSDYLHAAKVERHIVDSLWNAFYNEGVLELCGIDAHEPYVASKLFEPPLRAWAEAAEAADRNSVSEKKEAPLLINVGALILVGDRKDSATYVRNKKKVCEAVGIISYEGCLPENSTEQEVLKYISEFNDDPSVHGILIQLPLPRHMNEENILNAVTIEKDVAQNICRLAMRGRESLFVPCTPKGCIELLHRYGISIKGKRAVVIGRSNIVGMPVALLLQVNPLSFVLTLQNQEPEEITRQADIIISAVGQPNMVTGSWIKPGAVIIDVGINPVDDPNSSRGYRLVGDVCYDEACKIASASTWVQ